ncbi:MAG: hypothetical protein GYA41_09715 [Bacteroidales bacterium]|nr:hypothetical protein [Bacteroidales bacterium]
MEAYPVPNPLIFNPLKHYMPYIRDFVDFNARTSTNISYDSSELIKVLKHIGTSVMDVYTGPLDLKQIFHEICGYLEARKLMSKETFASWAGTGYSNYRITALSDSSIWTLKYHDSEKRYVHIFPARSSPLTFRIKANTLKSAILYLILVGKDYVTEDDLNRARAMTGLSPVKDVTETEAVTELIEIIRN